jgi:hypothetical protein
MVRLEDEAERAVAERRDLVGGSVVGSLPP